MANKKISDFSTLPTAQDSDLILVSSSNETYNMQVGTLKQAAGDAAIAAVEAIADEVVTDATAVARSAASAASGSATQAAGSASDASASAAAAAASASQAASSYVRYDQAQSLTDAQKAQARENIGSLAADWGSENEGKALVVDTDGSITTGDAGIPEAAKIALLNCFAHVAWIDEHGQDYYDALETALYPETGLVSITAVFAQGSYVVYPSTSLDDLKAFLTVTGYYNDGIIRTITDYALFGTLTVGTSTVTVSKEGVTTTFNVTVSAPYWDYEWSASSRTLPEGMTAVAYDFTTEEGALFAEEPNLDFDYIGSCRIQVEMAGFAITADDVVKFRGSNPQVVIINSVSGDNKQGIKFIWNFDGAGTDSGLGAVGINGVNTVLNIDTTTYHLIDITNDNNVYTLEVDGSPIALQQNTNQTQYLDHTGLSTAHNSSGSGTQYYAYIKTIKFKEL